MDYKNFNAKEARSIADNQFSETEFNSLLDQIMEKSKRGCFVMNIHYKLNEQYVSALKDKGFTVTYFPASEVYEKTIVHSIKW